MPDCLRKNNAARVQRVGRGCPPPNQPHQTAPRDCWGGWMGLGAAFEAVFMPGAQLIHSGPFLIQGVSHIARANRVFLPPRTERR